MIFLTELLEWTRGAGRSRRIWSVWSCDSRPTQQATHASRYPLSITTFCEWAMGCRYNCTDWGWTGSPNSGRTGSAFFKKTWWKCYRHGYRPFHSSLYFTVTRIKSIYGNAPPRGSILVSQSMQNERSEPVCGFKSRAGFKKSRFWIRKALTATNSEKNR